MKEKQSTNRDLKKSIDTIAEKLDAVIETIVVFANDTQKRFDAIDKRFLGIESTMVTKDFLEEKLGALRGNLVALTRKEDKKLLALVDVLHRKKVLTRGEANGIAEMDPFATLSLT